MTTTISNLPQPPREHDEHNVENLKTRKPIFFRWFQVFKVLTILFLCWAVMSGGIWAFQSTRKEALRRYDAWKLHLVDEMVENYDVVIDPKRQTIVNLKDLPEEALRKKFVAAHVRLGWCLDTLGEIKSSSETVLSSEKF